MMTNRSDIVITILYFLCTQTKGRKRNGREEEEQMNRAVYLSASMNEARLESCRTDAATPHSDGLLFLYQ